MVRTQIQLQEEQVTILKRVARVQHKSMAEIIRQAIDFFTSAKHPEATRECRKRAMAVAGQFSSSHKDLAVSHDKHLAEIFEK